MELRIAHLSRSFKDKKAVDDLSYTLIPGVYGLLGANGAGKTTLMRNSVCCAQTPAGSGITMATSMIE
ncbi:MAG: hypothetical protein ACLTCB_03435 [Merdibacter sp.]